MPEPHDWETDPRPFEACLKAWRTAHEWSWDELAAELRKPLSSIRSMAKGRTPHDEASLRRLMTLIDAAER